ncbi:uncharacterized protein LOC122659411 [Telopea speciosissima]|uniref:uncharacterized protein LOC122659411 n=1 Tax=Telopea speciosissima TaxID=54955 RepID=UPI001CC5B5E9|nr:uncharacterized protein LOC122659411 [Telopea speciosissima]
MISHGSLFLWVIILFVSSYTIIEGRNITREDYLEAKRLVKLSRRPSIKSIQAENGDIFDCVIIDKQLAFEHPALKNHTIQMKPTSIPKGVKEGEGSNHIHAFIGLRGGGCPVGSVPVRRLQIHDILRYKSISSLAFGRKYVDPSQHQWAVVESHGEFLGSRAKVNLWNPTVKNDNQFSLSQFWIVYEEDDVPLETIEAGWIVFPHTFGDQQTRFFIFWTNDGYRNGCYNLLCPGFVQVNHRVPLDSTFSVMSSFDGAQFYINLTVFKDTETQNWWVYVNGEHMGYWPKNLFSYLSSGAASRVDWGGEVFNSNPKGLQWPEMGSGQLPVGTNFEGQSCSTSSIQVLQGSQWNDYGLTSSFSTKPNCYKVIDGGLQNQWGRVITFGGPGGTC